MILLFKVTKDKWQALANWYQWRQIQRTRVFDIFIVSMDLLTAITGKNKYIHIIRFWESQVMPFNILWSYFISHCIFFCIFHWNWISTNLFNCTVCNKYPQICPFALYRKGLHCEDIYFHCRLHCFTPLRRYWPSDGG